MHELAVLFDWDGVVVDSSRQHERSWEQLAAAEGLTLPPNHFAMSFGRRNAQIIPDLFGWTRDPAEVQRLADRKEALYREQVRAEGIEALPGVRALLEALIAAGVPRAIASSTPRANLDAVLDLLGLRASFPAIVSAEDVTHGKPDPEVFLKAAAALGQPPEMCLVIEDAHVGIEAARRAGMRVLAVATTHAADTLQDADFVRPNLEGVSLATLRAWMGAAPSRPSNGLTPL